MPITDNNFTAAEVTAAVTANPALLTELKTGLQPLGHHAIPKDEYDGFVTAERDKISSEKTKEIYDNIDKDIHTSTGVNKTAPNEKTYEYLKRVLGGSKTATEGLQKQITDLQATIASGSGTQAMKDQLAALQGELSTYKEKKEPEYQAALFAKDVELEYALALREFKINPALPQTLVKPALDVIKQTMIASAKKGADGTIYYVDSAGKTILDGVNVANATFVLKSHLGELVDTGKQQQGGGSKPPIPGAAKPTGVKNADGADIDIPETVKSREELHDHLSSQGLLADSKEFNELFEKFGKNLPLRKPVAK